MIIPAVTHHVAIYATAFGWTWACSCGRECRGVGALRTQGAAYSAGGKHIRTEKRA